MSLSQPKFDLAVLLKLYQHAQSSGEHISREHVAGLFSVAISGRRVDLALEQLDRVGDAEREYDPFDEGGLWQISRQGMDKVDRALRVATTFMARLHANGDEWLNSAEAASAVLNKITPPAAEPDSLNVTKSIPAKSERPSKRIDWTKWGTIIAGAALLVAIATAVIH